MKIKNTAVGPRGYMDGGKAVVLQPGEEGECPSGVKLAEGLVEVKAKLKPAPKKVDSDKAE